MKAIELIGAVDDQHCLTAQAPEDLPPGPVRLLIPTPDPVEEVWMRGIAAEWFTELSDPRQDLYTIDDGQPLDGAR